MKKKTFSLRDQVKKYNQVSGKKMLLQAMIGSPGEDKIELDKSAEALEVKYCSGFYLNASLGEVASCALQLSSNPDATRSIAFEGDFIKQIESMGNAGLEIKAREVVIVKVQYGIPFVTDAN